MTTVTGSSCAGESLGKSLGSVRWSTGYLEAVSESRCHGTCCLRFLPCGVCRSCAEREYPQPANQRSAQVRSGYLCGIAKKAGKSAEPLTTSAEQSQTDSASHPST